MSDQITEQAPTNNTQQPVKEFQMPADKGAQAEAIKRKSKTNVPLLILVWLVVIVVILVVGLVVSSYIAGFNSVFDMINWIGRQL